MTLEEALKLVEDAWDKETDAPAKWFPDGPRAYLERKGFTFKDGFVYFPESYSK